MLKKLKTAFLNWFYSYTVIVDWEGMRVIHRAHTIEDAIEWVRCYPENAECEIL